MDAKELERRLEEARTFDHSIGSVTYRMRMPPRIHQGRALAAMRELVQLGDGAPESGEKLLEVVAPHVVGIVGATSADVCISGEPLPLEDSAASARLVLSEKLEHAALLAGVLSKRIVERNAALQADRKN
ncbi:MAG: hypothetical protein IT459_22585 [Planctomycetes bacterium]|nr:hypothetical protein [Planctomycetota bacterium]